MTQREALAKLKDMAEHLPDFTYDDIVTLIKKNIRRIPIPLAKLRAHSYIDRARKNNGDTLFTDVHNELSYIRDPHVIKNYLTEFGRANKPHQVLFYGAVNSTRVQTQRITAIAETSALFQDQNAVNLKGELYTVSRWENTIELSVAEIVYARDAIKVNPDIERSFRNQQRFAREGGFEDMDFYTDLLIFFSEQFARPKVTHHDYKISTAYADLAFQHPAVQGIAFPSVQTDYQGQNLVFPPPIVDQYFNVRVLAVQRLHKNKDRHYLNNFKNCENPQACLENIIWSDLPPQHISTDDYVQDFLAGRIH